MKLLIFDCDSTLSALEGIDELARVRGPAVFARVEAMTNDAMNGQIPVESIFQARLDIIQPARADVAAVGARYIATVEPTARATIAELKARGWTPLIVSGGFRQAIQPLAEFLDIARIEAVDLRFKTDGSYAGFDADFPTTRAGGKPELVARLQAELQPVRVVAVGDGVSDLEMQPVVERFFGFGRYVERPAVRSGSGLFIRSLDELLNHL
ncbi:MAG: HAD-IB family phosphatase [Opitutaceae bacterium]|nr:HAD-IB family phosphatase [Opitutaceae bacterium]